MSTEIQRHERYKQYANNAYNLVPAKFPQGTKLLRVYENKNTGFYAYTVKEGNDLKAWNNNPRRFQGL